jgi:hypothetical protein
MSPWRWDIKYAEVSGAAVKRRCAASLRKLSDNESSVESMVCVVASDDKIYSASLALDTGH